VKIRLWVASFWFLVCIPLLASFPYYLSLAEYLMIRYLATPYEHDDLAQLIRCAALFPAALLHDLGKPAGIETNFCIVLLSYGTECTEGHIGLEVWGDRRVHRH
jgi:hypothetical protein